MKFALRQFAYQNVNVLLLLFLSLAYLLLFVYPVLAWGAENIRLLEALNVDEAYFLRYIRTALDQRSFGVIMHNYGYLYFYLGLVPLMVLDQWVEVNDCHIVVLFRLLSALFFLATVMATYAFGKYVFNQRIGLLSAILLLLLSKDMYYSSIEFHPDTAQLFFIVMGIYFAYRFYFESSIKNLLFASFMAGCAYSCKYSGILLVPFIFAVFLIQGKTYSFFSRKYLWAVFAYLMFLLVFVNPFQLKPYLNTDWFGDLILIALWVLFCVSALYLVYRLYRLIYTRSTLGNEFTKRMDMLYLLALSFWLAFVFTSPGAVYNFTFVDSFQKVVGLASQGIGIDQAQPLTWLSNVVSFSFAGGWFIPLASLASIPWVLFFKKGLVKIVYPIWVWIAVFLGLVTLLVKLNYSYYLLPILPFVIILASFILESIASEINRKWNFFMIFTFIVAASVFIALIGLKFNQLEEYKIELHEPEIRVGNWLASQSIKGRVLSDYYIYIPPEIDSVKFTWGISPGQLAEEPDWIIVNPKIRKRWLNRSDEIGRSTNSIYSSLHRNSLYQQVKNFEGIEVYKKLEQ